MSEWQHKPTPAQIAAFHEAYDASLEMQPRETSQAIFDGLCAALSQSPERRSAMTDAKTQAIAFICEHGDFEYATASKAVGLLVDNGFVLARKDTTLTQTVVTDEMISAARAAYSKATGCDDTPHVLDGWIEDALRSSIEAAIAATTPGELA